jgi:hypothetical protein
VGQKDFEKLQPAEFAELLLLEITSAMLQPPGSPPNSKLNAQNS